MNLNYIITETFAPDSFDPLLGDKTNNILVMRTLYHTPIQINSSNELISNVLEKFEYNPQNFTITFTVKDDAGDFSDGTKIDQRDILNAILRMAYSMPKFPVVKDILGVHEWSDKKQGIVQLPSGITSSGNEIKIKLIRHNPNALFRFCLELFSIIPSKCIDLNSGKLTCEQPPFSGYYELESHSDKEYKFKLRQVRNRRAENIQYKTITFQYKKFVDLCQSDMSADSIIAGTDLGFNSSTCPLSFKQEQIHWLQASRFGVILFNPNVPPFDKAINRKFFSNKIRDNLKNSYKDLIVEASIFTKLLPGFLERSQIEKDSFALNEQEEFKGKNFYISKVPQSLHKRTVDSVVQVAKSLGMNIVELNIASEGEAIEKFLKNEVLFMVGSSGFWPQDPIGDLTMFFSKNLHKPLKFAWQDKKMYELINSIENESDALAIKEKMENFNRHLHEESLVAPVTHFRRLYITHDSIKSLNLPMAVTSPAPWHLIPTE